MELSQTRLRLGTGPLDSFQARVSLSSAPLDLSQRRLGVHPGGMGEMTDAALQANEVIHVFLHTK